MACKFSFLFLPTCSHLPQRVLDAKHCDLESEILCLVYSIAHEHDFITGASGASIRWRLAGMSGGPRWPGWAGRIAACSPGPTTRGGSCFPDLDFCLLPALRSRPFCTRRVTQASFNLTSSSGAASATRLRPLCSSGRSALSHAPSYHMAADWAALNGADDDDTALRRAIAMSLAQPPQGPPPCVQTKQQATSTSMSALGLDRKKMEEERLARTRKRKAEAQAGTTLAPTLADAYLHAESHALQAPPFQRPKLQSTQWTGPSGLNTEPRAQGRAGVPKARSHGPLQYPQGVVLRTWARGSPRDDDITIEEVFQKDELDLAVLSSWQWNEDWLFSKLDMTRTKVLLIAFANDDAQVCQPFHVLGLVGSIAPIPQLQGLGATGTMSERKADLVGRKRKFATMRLSMPSVSSFRQCPALPVLAVCTQSSSF